MTKVKVGDKVWVTNAEPYDDFYYKEGDTFYVAKVWDNGGIDTESGIELYTREFEVVPRNPHAEIFAEPMGNEVGAPEIPTFTPADLNGKLLRIYTGQDVEGDIKTEVTVGIDEATGVMYVLGMKTEVSE